MKLKFILAAISVIWLLTILTTAALAQGGTPPPYAGLKNPFPWDDASAQDAGKAIYGQSCLGCHGIKGNNLASYDFSQVTYSQSMEAEPDYYFWVLSEGRLDKGMPPFKSMPEEQRWQVLTYIHSLGQAATAAEPATPVLVSAGDINIKLAAPQQAHSGEQITLKATLSNSSGSPVSDTPVNFYIDMDFFTTGLMQIGEAVTDSQGIATLDYTPRLSGDVRIIASYTNGSTAPVDAEAIVNLIASEEPFYQAEAGIHITAPFPELFIGPPSALDLGEEGNAPASALRLPGSILSWLLLLVFTVMFIWFTYFRVMRQVFMIPLASEIREVNTRLVPMAGIGFVLFVGIVLTLMLITGPYSHLNLMR